MNDTRAQQVHVSIDEDPCLPCTRRCFERHVEAGVHGALAAVAIALVDPRFERIGLLLERQPHVHGVGHLLEHRVQPRWTRWRRCVALIMVDVVLATDRGIRTVPAHRGVVRPRREFRPPDAVDDIEQP